MDKTKVHFSLRSNAGGGFYARGLDVPISADAGNLRDLRAKLAAATRTFFGQDRELSILIGVQAPVGSESVAAGPSDRG